MNKQQNCEVNFTVFIVYLKYTIKANPSPNGNGFAFNLFGELANTRVEPKDWNMWRYFGLYNYNAHLSF